MSDTEQQLTPGVDEELEERREDAHGTGLSDDEEQPVASSLLNEDEDDDEDVQITRKRGRPEARTNGNVSEDDQEEGDDLFGDDEDNEDQRPSAKRQLDDEELDSGDDEGRDDRAVEGEEAAMPETIMQERITMEMEMPRQNVPEPSDGEMYLLKIPGFMSLDPKIFNLQTFQPPQTDHHSKKGPSETFSASKTALTTIRWRRSPNNSSQLQSNARINRWSDGSLTLQLASDPTTQYEMDGNPLAPPQRNPVKPTPVSLKGGQKGGRQGVHQPSEKYDQSQDAFTYLVTPMPTQEALRVTHKITAGLSIKQSSSVTDDAIVRLQKSMAEAANATKLNGGTGIELFQSTEDPEMGRKRAEQAEREKERARKRRENAELKTAERAGRVMGRHGMSSGRYGGGAGLTVGGLEDDELGTTMGGNRGRTATKSKKPRPRRNSEYSSDEDGGRGRFIAGNEDYELDDFVAGSDEEEDEGLLDDDDPDDGIVDEPSRRQKSPKRPADDDEDEDAEGEPDDEIAAPKAKRARRVVDDEDED